MSVRRITFLVISILLTIPTYSSGADEVHVIMDRTKDVILENPSYFVDNPTDSLINELMGMMDDKGAFVDIDYSNQEWVDYTPHFHDNRLVVMAAAYISENLSCYGSEKLYDKILKGLNYYYEAHPRSGNWWWNVIDAPQVVGSTLILMRYGKKQIPVELENNLIKRMEEEGSHPSNWVDASSISDIALHFFYRGLLTNDDDLIKMAVDYIYAPIKYSINDVGFQVDNSFTTNVGINQVYLSGYSDTTLRSVLRIAVATRGTRFEIDRDKRQLMHNYLLGTFSDIIRGKYLNYNCIGRHLTRKNALSTPEYWINNLYSRMLKIDSEHESVYQTVLKRLSGESPETVVNPRHQHFFVGDYTTFVRKSFNVGLRTQSNRTGRCETANMENLLGYYVSDGSYCISVHGDEYYNIMPLWDWKRIPGVTSPQDVDIPLQDIVIKGNSSWTGGVSDSLYGVTATRYYDTYQNVNTGANKSWFFFDDEVVCLGSNIYSDYTTMTGVDQCWGKQVLIKTKEGKYLDYDLIQDDMYRSDAVYVHHNNIGYYFPDETEIVLSNKDVKNSWTIINRDFPQDVDSGRVFSLAVDHGKPSGAVYSYIIVPSVSKEGMDKYVERSNIDILENNDKMQIVYHKGLDIYGMVFYEAEKYERDGIVVNPHQPCILLIKNSKSEQLSCHIQDPTQGRKNMKVDITTPVLGKLNGFADYTNIGEGYEGMSMLLQYANSTGLLPINKTDDGLALDSYIYAGVPFTVRCAKAQGGYLSVTNINGIQCCTSYFLNGKVQCVINTPGVYVLSVKDGDAIKETRKIIVR